MRISARGPEAEAALAALKRLIEQEEAEEIVLGGPTHGWSPRAAGATVPGLAASPGLAIGPLRLLRQSRIVVERCAKDPERERRRLDEAIDTARVELQELYQEVKAKSGAAGAAIFLAHAEFLADPDLLARAGRRIAQGESAGWAWRETIEAEADSLAKLDDPLLAGRATDLRDVGTRVLRRLAEVIEEEPELPAEPVILLAEDLTPSDAAALDPARVLGFCTARRRADLARGDHRAVAGDPGRGRRRAGGDAPAGGRAGGPRRRQRRPLCRSERGRSGRGARRAELAGGSARRGVPARATSRRSPPTACASRWSPTPAWRGRPRRRWRPAARGSA